MKQKLKITGNVMLTQKLQGLLKAQQSKLWYCFKLWFMLYLLLLHYPLVLIYSLLGGMFCNQNGCQTDVTCPICFYNVIHLLLSLLDWWLWFSGEDRVLIIKCLIWGSSTGNVIHFYASTVPVCSVCKHSHSIMNREANSSIMCVAVILSNAIFYDYYLLHELAHMY